MTKHMSPRARGIVAVRADAGGDVKATLAELTKTFEEFKAANDERLNAKADVVAIEKVDRINEAVTELQTKLDEATKAAKDNEAIQARMDELETMAGRLKAGGGDKDDRDFKAEASVFLAGKRAQEAVKLDADEVSAYETYTKAFATLLKYGENSPALSQEVRAAMQVGSEPDGGYWVPTQMVNDIKQRLFETSPMRQVADALTITTDSVKFPTDVNDATSGGWVGETASRSVTATPQIGEQTIYVREQYAQPKVTQKLLDMATIDVEAWLNGKISDKMARTENTAFVNGSGVNQPCGFLDYTGTAVTTDDAASPARDWGKLQYVASGAAGGFPDASGIAGAKDPDALITIISKLKPAYRAGAIFAMNRATEAAIRKLKDADGRYLVEGVVGTEGSFNFRIHGFPIVNMEDMPDIGSDSFSLAFGNFRIGYQIVDGRGIRVLRDNLTDKPYVKFYTTKWTGGDVVNFDALKLMKFASS